MQLTRCNGNMWVCIVRGQHQPVFSVHPCTHCVFTQKDVWGIGMTFCELTPKGAKNGLEKVFLGGALKEMFCSQVYGTCVFMPLRVRWHTHMGARTRHCCSCNIISKTYQVNMFLWLAILCEFSLFIVVCFTGVLLQLQHPLLITGMLYTITPRD